MAQDGSITIGTTVQAGRRALIMAFRSFLAASALARRRADWHRRLDVMSPIVAPIAATIVATVSSENGHDASGEPSCS
jgi:hypothetical protein